LSLIPGGCRIGVAQPWRVLRLGSGRDFRVPPQLLALYPRGSVRQHPRGIPLQRHPGFLFPLTEPPSAQFHQWRPGASFDRPPSLRSRFLRVKIFLPRELRVSRLSLFFRGHLPVSYFESCFWNFHFPFSIFSAILCSCNRPSLFMAARGTFLTKP